MTLYICVVFFFKQKTAYEMRIWDWSSDVCSSDLKYGSSFMLTGIFPHGIAKTNGHDQPANGHNKQKMTGRSYVIGDHQGTNGCTGKPGHTPKSVKRGHDRPPVHGFHPYRLGIHGNVHHIDRKSTRLNSSH